MTRPDPQLTLGVVARKLGRNFVGIELNQKYITEIAQERIENEKTMFDKEEESFV